MSVLVAPIYAFISLILARVLVFEKQLDATVARIFITWALLVPAALLFNNPPVQFFLAFIVLMGARPKGEAIDSVLYCLGVLPAMPQYLAYDIPFPGLNYLYHLTYWKLVILVVLLPVYLDYSRRPHKKRWDGVDTMVFVYVIFTGLLSIREVSFTSMVRFTLDQFVLIFLPYFAIVRTVNQPEYIDRFIKLLYYLAIILAGVGLVSTVKVWDFYRLYEGGITQVYLFRNGFLRINLTINTASLATIMIFGLVALEYFKPSRWVVGWRLWGMRVIFLAIIYFTGNRGALLQCGMALGIFYLLLKTGRGFRSFLMVGLLVALVFVIGALPFVDWESFDDQGTFEYRYDIIVTSLLQMSQYPLFGKMHYLDTGNFNHLIQGEGIVDIVNWYLQLGLEYGGIGLGLFMGMYLNVLLGLYRQFNALGKDDERRYWYAFVLSSFIPYLVLLGTTSNVSILPLLGVIILAFGKSLCNLNSHVTGTYKIL
jgi:O-antigen ligase